MIRLYQFPPVWDLPNASPFCMKLETWLRLAQLPYEVRAVGDPRKSPKGKLPYIRDTDGTVVADSSAVIEYLQQRRGDLLDAGRSRAERATALAWQRLIEEHLYWCVVYDRWVVAAHWQITGPAYFAGLPWFPRQFVPALARRHTRQQLWMQGLGRHTADEIYRMGEADIDALAAFLDDKPWFLGSEPATLDATAYGFLANILGAPIESRIKHRVQQHRNLVDYCARVRARCYGARP